MQHCADNSLYISSSSLSVVCIQYLPTWFDWYECAHNIALVWMCTRYSTYLPMLSCTDHIPTPTYPPTHLPISRHHRRPPQQHSNGTQGNARGSSGWISRQFFCFFLFWRDTQNSKSEKNKEKQADHGLTVCLPVEIKKKKGGPLLKIWRAKKIRKHKRTTDWRFICRWR